MSALGRNQSGLIKGQVLLCGNSHRELAQRVATRLGIPLGDCVLYQENCGETKIQIGESVRGKDVFILQTGNRDPNNMMMELFILAYSCRSTSAQRIVGVVPYLPYSKQCRMRKRGSIPCKLFADMMVRAGIQHLITMDLHMKEIQGFFSCPVDNLRASSFLIQYLKEQQTSFENVVVVARHPGQARRATAYAERLRTTLSVIHGGEGVVLDTEATDGRSSPPLIAQNSLQTPSLLQTPEKNNFFPVSTAAVTACATDYDAPTDSTFPKSFCPKATQLTPGDIDQIERLPEVIKPSPIHSKLMRSLTGCASCRVRSYSEGQQNDPLAEGVNPDETVLSGEAHFPSMVSPGKLLRKQSDSRAVAFYRADYMPSLTAKKKPPINVVGDVDGKIALIVEDIIDDVEGFCAAAKFLKDRGARHVKVMCTHGLLSKESIALIEKSHIDEVIITNTVPNEDLVLANNNNQSHSSQNYQYCNSSSVKYHKITVVDVSVLLSEGIRRIHNGESMSYLFRDIPLDD